jgi:ABC-type nitrate/sulfonate/bicarbonate transport system, ATPase component
VLKSDRNLASSKISLEKITVIFDDGKEQVRALENLSFSIRDKEFVCILGPSGCGKSTVLRLIAGFIQPTSGEVRVNGHLVQQPDADRGVVFQRYNLFPWRKVRENIEFGLRMKGLSKDQRQKISAHYLEAIGLSEFANRYPHHLSVGMQQRVGIARAYANDPDILLMDEPFASLDAQSGIRMRELLLRIWSQNMKTVVFITHDIDEAIELADRVLLLSARPGRLKEEFYIDLPRPRAREIFADPRYMELRKRMMNSIFDSSTH